MHTIDYADTNFSSPTVIDSEIFIWTDIKKFSVLMKCKFCTNCGNYLLSETIVENTYLFNKILCSCNRVTDDIDCHEYQIIDNNYQIIDNYCQNISIMNIINNADTNFSSPTVRDSKLCRYQLQNLLL